jgi:hypothetical protein
MAQQKEIVLTKLLTEPENPIGGANLDLPANPLIERK